MIYLIIENLPQNRWEGSLPITHIRKASTKSPRKGRILVEFPESLLRRADEAARSLEKNRSELIRLAVERMLAELEKKRFELELAAGYAANTGMNLELAEDFAHIDREGF